MNGSTQREKAERLRALHKRGDPVVLVNVWDAVSARIIESLGFPAIATTSAGIAWAEGFADGERISRERMLQGVARVTSAVSVPVTADLESGYGASGDDAAATAKGAVAAGAVGMNFEDFDERRQELIDAEAQAERVAGIRAAADAAGVPLVINARTDVFLRELGDDDAWRMQEAVRRGNRYLRAGADCIFVPGVTDERTVAELAEAIAGPINVLAGPATPNVSRLGELGVARVSVGGSGMAYALAQFKEMAKAIRETGSFELPGRRLSHAELDALFE